MSGVGRFFSGERGWLEIFQSQLARLFTHDEGQKTSNPHF